MCKKTEEMINVYLYWKDYIYFYHLQLLSAVAQLQFARNREGCLLMV